MVTKKSWPLWAVGVAGLLLALVSAGWAYTNGVEKRLTSCEVWVVGSHSDIQEIKEDVRTLRHEQKLMWRDLIERMDRGQ